MSTTTKTAGHRIRVTADPKSRTGKIARCTCGWEALRLGGGGVAQWEIAGLARRHIKSETGCKVRQGHGIFEPIRDAR